MSNVENKANVIWGAVLLLMVVALGLVYYKYQDYFSTKANIVVPFDPACDLKDGPCETVVEGIGKVRFGISPETIPLLEPLDLEVQLAGFDAGKVEVDFSGVDMNMGFNRHLLNSSGTGMFKGQATLPVCIRKRMDWEAKVMLYLGSELVVVPFRFETIK